MKMMKTLIINYDDNISHPSSSKSRTIPKPSRRSPVREGWTGQTTWTATTTYWGCLVQGWTGKLIFSRGGAGRGEARPKIYGAGRGVVDCPTQLTLVIWICQLSRRWGPFKRGSKIFGAFLQPGKDIWGQFFCKMYFVCL